MPAPKQLDLELSPTHFFGAEFWRARESANISQTEFGNGVPCDVSTVSRADDATLTAFPDVALLVRFYRASGKRSDGSGPVPLWSEEWLRAITSGVAALLTTDHRSGPLPNGRLCADIADICPGRYER